VVPVANLYCYRRKQNGWIEGMVHAGILSKIKIPAACMKIALMFVMFAQCTIDTTNLCLLGLIL